MSLFPPAPRGQDTVAASVEPPWDPVAWRTAARAALCADIPPDRIDWTGGAQGSLLGGLDVRALPATRPAPRVPSEFMGLADAVLCHRDPDRHGLLYRMLWRIAHGERALLQRMADPDVHRARILAQAIRRDTHKMKAFVRFRAVPGADEQYVAWFEPDHAIVDRVAPFFMRRFTGMRWAIVTPYRTALWDGSTLAFAGGGTRADAPADDANEDLWRTYYGHIFNPARLNPTMMRSEMPQKYWKHLPEAALLPTLIRDAGVRVREMAEREHEAPRRRIPDAPQPAPVAAGTLEALREEARDCRRCPLWEPATQTVFGEGPSDARTMIVGEQPGDEEDLSGRPFVGPAGRLFARALDELGIARDTLYLTNAVKHFRFEPRGKRRIHSKPGVAHINACNGWLQREIALVRPARIVCLGASAARAVFGPGIRLTESRGVWRTRDDGIRAFATVHPSWVLRQADDAARAEAYAGFVDDLRELLDA
ncbi:MULTISPECIES: UdgX family uracil-DNA binding protein [Luteimonas]|uniref:UdgX family uracil-DNA binding protein n=1 Tax=Luteimonas TaxID=83614 RepID=UPI000C7A558A|nr:MULTISPECIES: UdgX family uracil-DNA binding protein [Luteimonas]